MTDHSNSQARDNRVLWLLNHTTLRESEIPLLRRFGLEVYAPKKFPDDAGNRSASVTYEFDDTLTISKADLEVLNDFNFYTNPPTPAIRRIINREFGTAIVAYMFPMLDNMIAQYKNRILLRAFGLTSHWTYYDFARHVSAPGFRRRIANAGDRFWFAQAYPNLSTIEPAFMQERTLDLPLGLPDRITSQADTWVGGDQKILFVCPDIKTFSENELVYKEFKASLGHLPHAICGAQTIPITDDPAVLGRVSGDEYARLYRECSVMFYHSQLPRHLHYHPVEAVAYGMPLIFMKQGMLGELGGRSLPGACRSVSEARSKIERLLLNNDEHYRKEVRESQKVLLDHFSPANNLAKWSENFIDRALKTPLKDSPVKRRIAILALDASLASCSEALRLANRLARAAASSNAHAQFMVGLPRNEKNWPEHKAMPGVILREINWTTNMDHADVRTAQRMLGLSAPLFHHVYKVPEDGSSQFMECESWVFVGREPGFHPAPLKPYAVFITPNRILDRDVRLQAANDDQYSQLLHSARAVVSSDIQALQGVARKYAIRGEMLLDASETQDALDDSQLWQTLQELA